MLTPPETIRSCARPVRNRYPASSRYLFLTGRAQDLIVSGEEQVPGLIQVADLAEGERVGSQVSRAGLVRGVVVPEGPAVPAADEDPAGPAGWQHRTVLAEHQELAGGQRPAHAARDRKSTRLNSSHVRNSYAVFC